MSSVQSPNEVVGSPHENEPPMWWTRSVRRRSVALRSGNLRGRWRDPLRRGSLQTAKSGKFDQRSSREYPQFRLPAALPLRASAAERSQGERLQQPLGGWTTELGCTEELHH